MYFIFSFEGNLKTFSDIEKISVTCQQAVQNEKPNKEYNGRIKNILGAIKNNLMSAVLKTFDILLSFDKVFDKKSCKGGKVNG